ncbi:MAG: hypothetical protein MJ071_03690 [Oscillospiraceae bacterium]|nr:hypothetical protein [Oscillospiraceae bacterium]
MKNNQKHIIMLTALLPLIAFAGCGTQAGSESGTAETSAVQQTESQTDAPTETNDASSEQSDGEPNQDDHTDSEKTATESASDADEKASGSSNGTAANHQTAIIQQTTKTTVTVPVDTDLKVITNPTIGIGKIKAKPGDTNVAVPVVFVNNPGFTVSGIQVFYDEALSLVMKDEEAKYDFGEAVGSLTGLCKANTGNHTIAFASMGVEDSTKSGTIFTFYLDIPKDAKVGQTYSLPVNTDCMYNLDMQELSVDIICGEIEII